MQVIVMIVVLAVFVLMGVSIVLDMINSHRFRKGLERESAAFHEFLARQLRVITPKEQAELDKLKKDLEVE
jgi:hypothetical protein